MNVLFVGSDPKIFEAGSPARLRLEAYAQIIGEGGGELHVLTRANETQDISIGNLFLHGVRTGRMQALVTLPKIGSRLIRERSIQVVSAQDPFEHGLMALYMLRGTLARLHIQVHTDFLSPWFLLSGNLRSIDVKMPALNFIRRRIANYVLPQASGIRTVSMRVRDSLIHKYGANIRIPSVIPITVSQVVPARVELPEHEFTFTLLTAGRLEPEKRIEDIIDALHKVHVQYPSVGLCIVGDGRERTRLERMVRNLKLTKSVVFVRWQEGGALGIMQSAQVYIQASAYEGYSMTLLEAALARIPIITTDVGIVGEVLRGYEEALVAPVADPSALALHIIGMVADAQAREVYIRNAERAAREHLAKVKNQPAEIVADLALAEV